jgi:ABC-2 type transport system ATP-binding protein
MDPILEIKDLKKHYREIKAVDGISFSIEPGICFGLLGPNGAGKTTAIEVIEGILAPTSGEIFYKGKHRGQTFKDEVGIQFQNTELPQFLTVKETLVTFRNLYDRRADMDYLIETCRLEEMLKQDNHKISGGQKQRLLLAMALANDPELIFLDEPTTGLDPQARRHLWDIVNQIKSLKKSIVLTTHYMEEAELLCDVIGIIDYGKIIVMGPPQRLLEEYGGGATITIQTGLDDAILQDFPCNWYRKQDRIEILTDSPNECISRMVRHGVDLTTMNVHTHNLEELFLKLTGHDLRA